jgi:hypothetical protein
MRREVCMLCDVKSTRRESVNQQSIDNLSGLLILLLRTTCSYN